MQTANTTIDWAATYGWTPAGWDAYCAAIDRGAPREVAKREAQELERSFT